MSDELYEWYSNNSKEAGTTMSSMISTILHQYKEGRFTVTNETINAGIRKIENIIVRSQPRGKQSAASPNPGREQMAMRIETEQLTQYFVLQKKKDDLTNQMIDAFEKQELSKIEELKIEYEAVLESLKKINEYFQLRNSIRI